MKINWEFPSEQHLIFLKGNARYKCLYGGRGGAKSWAAAMSAIIIADCKKTNVLFTREVQNSIQDSMYRLVKNLIIDKGLEKNFKILEKGITSNAHGGEFIFKGMQDVKSLEDIDIVIIEEAQDASKDNLQKLFPTIRKECSEIWLIWNPENEEDYVHTSFIEKCPPNCIIRKVNYTDNIFCSKEIIEEANYMKETDLEEYRHIWLGELKPKGKGWRTFNPKWFDYAASGEVKPFNNPRLDNFWVIGSDPAFQGVDKWATFEGKGNKLLTLDLVDRSDNTTVAANINARVLAKGRFNCKVGVDSIGNGVGDILWNNYGLSDCVDKLNRKDKDYVAIPAKGVPAGAEAHKFDCYRSQAYYLAARDLEYGNIDLSYFAENQQEEYKQLKRELEFHEITADKRGMQRVTAKEIIKKPENLGHSPDIADAFVAWNWVRKRVDDIVVKTENKAEKQKLNELQGYFV